MFEWVDVSLPLIAWVLLAFYGVATLLAAACVVLALTVKVVVARKRIWKQCQDYLRHLLVQDESAPLPFGVVIGEEVK
jgi:hypothetical protein